MSYFYKRRWKVMAIIFWAFVMTVPNRGAAQSLTGDTSANDYPRSTGSITVQSNVVTDISTSTPVTSSYYAGNSSGAIPDYFYGVYGLSYLVTIGSPTSNPSLFNLFNNTGAGASTFLTSSNTPANELIAIDGGTFINYGILNDYPLIWDNSKYTYNQTQAVVYVGGPANVINYGVIGDATSTVTNNPSNPLLANVSLTEAEGHLQVNQAGIYQTQNNTLLNYGNISGFNAVFNGQVENYGTILGYNDGILSANNVNYLNAGVNSTYTFGFANIHSYGGFSNYGYSIGEDYGVLQEGTSNVVNLVGGPLVLGPGGNPLLNYNGQNIYNGEVSTVNRYTRLANDQTMTGQTVTYLTNGYGNNYGGTYPTGDAIMTDGDRETVNLTSTVSGSSVYIPVTVGTILGGYNGVYGNGSANQHNILNFDLNGISTTAANNLISNLVMTANDNPFGYNYGPSYSGRFDITNYDGSNVHYSWDSWAGVFYTGIPAGYVGVPIWTGTGVLGTDSNDGIVVTGFVPNSSPASGSTYSTNTAYLRFYTGGLNGTTQMITGTQEVTGQTLINSGWTLQLGDGASANNNGIIAQVGGGAVSGENREGDTIVNNGTLLIKNVANGGTLKFGGQLLGSGNLVLSGTQPLNLNTVELYTGHTTLNSGSMLTLSNGGSIAASNGLTMNGTATFDISQNKSTSNSILLQGLAGGSSSTIRLGANNLTVVSTANSLFNGVIQDGGLGGGTGGSFSKDGLSTLTLGGVNTYTGNTVIGQGTLALASTGTIVNSNSVVLSSNTSTLDISAGNQILNSIAGVSGSVVNLGSQQLAFGNSLSTEVDSNITGNGGKLVKQGSGAVLFTGNNSYNGGLTINSGTVLAGNYNALGAGNVTNNATLGASTNYHVININGNFVQNSAGTTILNIAGITPGSSNPASNQAYDQLQVAGSASLAGTLQLNSINGFSPATRSNFTLVSAAKGVNVQSVVVAKSSGNTTLSGSGSGGGVLTVNDPFPTLNISTVGPNAIIAGGSTSTSGGSSSNGGANSGSSSSSGGSSSGEGMNFGGLYGSFGINLSQGKLSTLPAPYNYTENQRTVAQYLDLLNENPANLANNSGYNNLILQYDVLSASPSAFTSAFDQLMPLNFSRFAITDLENNSAFFVQQFNNYLENRRDEAWYQRHSGGFAANGAGFQFDSSHLVIRPSGYDPALSYQASRLLPWQAGASASAQKLADDSDALLSDKKSLAAPAPIPTNMWTVSLDGDVTLSQNLSDSNSNISHGNSTTSSFGVKADYQFAQQFIAGFSFDYAHTDGTLDSLNSKATVDSYTPGVYASYSDQGWFGNGLLTYGEDSFTQDRHVSIGTITGSAQSAPTADQLIADMDGGYDIHFSTWTATPLVGVEYTRVALDSYEEAGSTGANLDVNNQTGDSLRSRFGCRIVNEIALGQMTLRPRFSANWLHEFLNQNRGVTSQLPTLGSGNFTVFTGRASRDSGLIALGSDIDFDRTFTGFFDYQIQAGQNTYFGQSADLGVKVGF